MYVRYAFCSSLLRIVKIQDETVQENLLNLTWQNVNEKYPNWKQNEIIKKGEGLNFRYKMYNLYMKTLNKYTYKIYTTLLSLL